MKKCECTKKLEEDLKKIIKDQKPRYEAQPQPSGPPQDSFFGNHYPKDLKPPPEDLWKDHPQV